ncbi:MAG: DUF523 domain-containing protein [Planctomycetota bacterium]|nr:MAG: DUF523 domain-containing protein [Planctomycetota bacterium]
MAAGFPESIDDRLPDDLRPGETVLVSACLLGEDTAWDGRDNTVPALVAALHRARVEILSLCPEMLGGLPARRPPAEPERGDGRLVAAGRARILTRGDGRDVTDAFLAGAREAAARAVAAGVRYAFLQERSPSCGVAWTHAGGATVPGPGVTAALLAEAGITVVGIGRGPRPGG